MNKKKQTDLLNKKLKIITWIQKFSILYNLLIFSKKRFKYSFISFPSDLFFILLLPLLGYTLDKNFLLYNNSNSEFFFKKTLPGLNNFNIIISSNFNWETFNYTEYFKKINWTKLKKINYFDNSIFICFNSNLYNRNFYIGTQIQNKQYINSNELLKILNENKINKKKFYLFNKKINYIEQHKKFNKLFITGRFFNQFFKPSIYNKINTNRLYNYSSNNLICTNQNLKKKNFKKLKHWQFFFYELDYIPIKLDSIFFNNTNLNIDLKNKLVNKPLFTNLFFNLNQNKSYFLKNSELKELKKKKLIKCEHFKTIIEKKNKRLTYEMFNKKPIYNLWNFRFFQYKVYNKFFLLKFFLNNQINNFNYNKKNISNIFSLLINTNNFINKYEKKLLEKNNIFLKFIENQKEPNWKNLLRKDLKNLGNTKIDKFFNLDKIKNQSINFFDFQENYLNILNLENKNEKNSLFFFKNTIKNPLSLNNRENKNILAKINDTKKYLKKNKLYNINNKKYSFISSIERELFNHLKFLIKTNKVLDLKAYSDKIIMFAFKNYNFINYSENYSNNINNYLKQTILIKDRIIEGNSDLLKRKMSGYLYPDNQKTNLLFINKFSLFNNSFIKIQGQKNFIYKDFKKFYNNLFFLYNDINLINYNLEQNNFNKKNKEFYLKNKNFIRNKFFFGNSFMDFGLAFNYDQNVHLKTKKENNKINYKPNLKLIYNKRRLDTKIPFSYEYPIKDELFINYNYYYNSILFNKKKFFIYSSDKVSNKFITHYDLNLNNNKLLEMNNKLLEINDYNEVFLFPISYKSHFEYNKNYDFLNIYYSSFIKNFKNIFNADLYEVITLKKCSLLIQFVFLLIFLKLINNLKENYGQSFLIAFKIFFINFEFDALTNLKIEVGKTIKSNKIKFNNLIGGKIFLQEFNQTILLLKNSKYGLQSNLNIKKPEFNFNVIDNKVYLYSQNNKYKNIFFSITNKQKNFISNFIYNPFNFIFFNLIQIQNTKPNLINLKNTITIKGFLLVGPPGTGKTLLVKALSGESDVPIILESGEKLSKLNFQNDSISENAQGALQLKNLFRRAKKLSPCILFLDEIDNVGQNRKDVLIDSRKQNLKNYSKTNSLYFLSNNKINIGLLNLSKLKNNNNLLLDLKTNLLLNLKNNYFLNLKKKINNVNIKSLSILTQLLCELDGLKNRRDLVIIGSTNRPKTLDPALIRPGRLNKIIYIDLPKKNKRFELLKFYSKNKINNNINWGFFANQTTGLSAAHLSSAINIALLKKIYKLKKQKNAKVLTNIKKQNLNNFSLIQDFENIEYGIQIIKFKDISFKYKSYELGLLINKLLINDNYYNQLTKVKIFKFSNVFLIYNKLYIKNNNNNNFIQISKKKIKLTNLKNNLRTIFYKKNKKFIRHLYLLNKKNNTKLFFMKINNYYLLNNFYKYLNRVFKVNMFSCSILLFSTYILNNPLIFSFHFLYDYLKIRKNNIVNIIKKDKRIVNNNFILFKYNNILKYKLIWYNFKLTDSIYFLSNKNFSYEKNKIFSIHKKLFNNNKNFFNNNYQYIYKKESNIQKLILNDSIFINRSSYYLGGKALLLNILKKPLKKLNYFNLWLIKNKFDKNKIKKDNFIKILIKKLINKEEFENYLLFIITGKISEIKFLFNNNLRDFSNIAIDDLKEIGWLLNIMINKNFFYKKLKLKLFKQIIIQDLKNSIKINNKIMTNNKNNNIKFQHKLILLKNQFNKNFLLNKKSFIHFNNQKFSFWDLIPYWWEFNLKITNINLIYCSFSKSKKFNFLTLLYQNSFKYKYYYNFINNKLKFSKNIHFKPNKLTYLNNNLNINFLDNFFKSEINWNNFLLIEYYILISNIMFSLINKTFNILNKNSELLDYFSYYIICNESFYDFELNKMCLKFYNNTK